MTCWLARFSDKPCQGRMDPVHLISKQVLKRKFGGVFDVWDHRIVVRACRYHHGQMDNYRLSVPREALPEALEAMCAELGVGWWLDRRYGPQTADSADNR